MPIEVNCECGNRFNALDKLAGKRVRCLKCGSALLVPGSVVPSGGVLRGGGSVLDTIASAFPQQFSGSATVAVAVFVPFILLGIANGLGTSLTVMFFSGGDGGLSGGGFSKAVILVLMVAMSMMFMNCVSPVLAILGGAYAAPMARSRTQAGIAAGVSAAVGMFCMFVIYGLMVVVSLGIFGPSSGDRSKGGTEGWADLGSMVKLVIATFLPVVFAASTSAWFFWKPLEHTPSQHLSAQVGDHV